MMFPTSTEPYKGSGLTPCCHRATDQRYPDYYQIIVIGYTFASLIFVYPNAPDIRFSTLVERIPRATNSSIIVVYSCYNLEHHLHGYNISGTGVHFVNFRTKFRSSVLRYTQTGVFLCSDVRELMNLMR